MVAAQLPNPIRYSDIDIFHTDEEFARFIAGKEACTEKSRTTKVQKRKHQQFKAIQYVPYRDGVDINYVCIESGGSLRSHIENADINGVKIGCLITYSSTRRVTSQWILPPEFKMFLASQTLAACDFTALVKPRNALTTLIRLLHKSQLSNLRCEVPTDEVIIRMCHGRAISFDTIEKYGNLCKTHKRIIDRLLFFQTEVNKKLGTTLWRFYSRNAGSSGSAGLSSLEENVLSLSSYIHTQAAGTCYAHAVATAVRATESRIVGRHPKPHAEIVQEIVSRHGSNGADAFEVLRRECAQRCLGCCEVAVANFTEALQSNRTALVRFRFSEDIWTAFSSFFKKHPSGILSVADIARYKPDLSLPPCSEGHAVCAKGLLCENGKPYVYLKNSWGTSFADNGCFKVGLDVIARPEFGFEIFDVFFRICDLTPEDLQNYEEAKNNILRLKNQMRLVDY
eukprot:TRINITY_DN32073_c0_g1_i1.p1 TRINITY_DN32073_c0_g1~~TRINITY_DN32073_c0_g1_i1.p1  ORF type:complete len:513 (+),score=42.28 TRINITY_DN32073_c0_g1_i1:183-1541(+)